jgi:hypothetical protein
LFTEVKDVLRFAAADPQIDQFLKTNAHIPSWRVVRDWHEGAWRLVPIPENPAEQNSVTVWDVQKIANRVCSECHLFSYETSEWADKKQEALDLLEHLKQLTEIIEKWTSNEP